MTKAKFINMRNNMLAIDGGSKRKRLNLNAKIRLELRITNLNGLFVASSNQYYASGETKREAVKRLYSFYRV